MTEEQVFEIEVGIEEQTQVITLQFKDITNEKTGYKQIQLILTDEKDPFFFYNFNLDQQSFDHFKVEQNIIVSFEEFIPQLLDLFATYQKLKYKIQIKRNSKDVLILEILESNKMRKLTHLQLIFISFSEEEIKDRILKMFQDLQVECETLRLETKTNQENFQNEHEKLQLKHEENSQELESLSKEFQQHKEESENEKKKLQQGYELELEALELKLQEEIKEIKEKIQDLEQINKRLEDENKVLKENHDALEPKIEEILKENDKIAEEKVELNNLLIFQQTQNKTLEDTIEQFQKEVLKGNEIIQKLQLELQEKKTKLSLISKVASKQEKLFKEKEEILIGKQKQVEDLKTLLKFKEEEVIKLVGELTHTRKKVEEKDENLKANENMINWLNNQLQKKLNFDIQDSLDESKELEFLDFT